MAIYPVSIALAPHAQHTLLGQREHCSVDPRYIPLTIGQQVRVIPQGGKPTIYTAIARFQEHGPIIRMAPAARKRMGLGGAGEAVLDTQVTDARLTEQQARANGYLVEHVLHSERKALIALAPHGGGMEEKTDRQAQRVAEQLRDLDVAFWVCKGWDEDGDAWNRWHISSHDLHEASFPLLQSVMAERRFERAVAFHGYTPAAGEPDVAIGGLATPEMRTLMKRAIEGLSLGLQVSMEPNKELAGIDPRNIVNRLAQRQQGVQIEQSFSARKAHWRAIADAVAAAYRPILEGQRRHEH